MKILLLAALSLGFPRAEAPMGWGGKALMKSPLLSGALWGKTLAELKDAHGVVTSAELSAPAPTWFLEGTLLRLWNTSKVEGFQVALAAPETWLILREGRLFGLVRRVPLAEWDSYEAPARQRFGGPTRRHFVIHHSSVTARRWESRGSAISDPMDSPKTRYMHVYRWSDQRAMFFIIKPTWKDDFKQWESTQDGTVMRVRLMQKAEDESVPLFVAAFDPAGVRKLRR